MAKKLYDADILQSLCLSLQTRNTEVLSIVRRGGFGINNLDFYIDKCKEIDLPYSTELIIGNPGETVKSWKEGYIEY